GLIPFPNLRDLLFLVHGYTSNTFTCAPHLRHLPLFLRILIFEPHDGQFIPPSPPAERLCKWLRLVSALLHMRFAPLGFLHIHLPTFLHTARVQCKRSSLAFADVLQLLKLRRCRWKV